MNGSRCQILLSVLLCLTMNAVPASAPAVHDGTQEQITRGMDLDRSGDFVAARRIFLEVLQAVDRESESRERTNIRAILRRLEASRDSYPALDAALDYHDLLVASPAGKWVKLHEQQPTDSIRFLRQQHAGSAFDSRRGRLIVFGSDTHGYDWQNSPLFFDPALGEWSRAYAEDSAATYTVNNSGLPVAGVNKDHPWAMHTFGAVCYDAARDQVVIASHPAHLEPGRFTDALIEPWGQVRRHPTWIFSLKDNSWSALPIPAISFFPHAAVYDSDRAIVIGYKTSGIFELSRSPASWRQVISGGLAGWHNNAVYDSANKAVIGFGSNENSNDVIIYEPATGRHQKMPTPGNRPPKAQHTPMAFHPGIEKTIVLVPDHQRDSSSAAFTETWSYDLGTDAWQRVATARLPFAIGMNYNMEYDSMRNILLLVASPGQGATAVWALRF